ncbi:serine/threonine-protein kinase fray1 [Lingula anatina]|uniref:Serine/threonine-protein kinase fray1 n=1 Tax=Lingula anatina TaxID=7574 RepID=A0A1S3IHM8_LINAN|nr:serine/threonine-protein kinase fray1 [Lingula anatina]XP_013397765.1 serine/threonine-protein kinase fray1 [Lingula anatina]XP_013397850.1 serine/threonine-protein kinase fray1 [Lingula anatina]XP_013397925.1 serine/threonine-protein kinase fray1 [Lingula anatina]XP_013398002.1 serine/threonine-protein kinase fray1 [Lingula anatina]XP_013398079.1 serine/threonine-protein kinase fray1 [Lingula anatina]|eukprot:XP_013397693.1 serine/threonine-protein kinase fray1 [Lingula anatina]
MTAASLGNDIPFHQIKPEEIQVEKSQKMLLGQGGFGAVYKGIYLAHGAKQIAVKVMHTQFIPEGGLLKQIENELLKEAKNMYAVRSEHVVAIYGMIVVPEDKEYALVMEFMEHGSLDNLMKKVDYNIPWPVRMNMLTHVASGLVWLHDKKMVHRDIKIQNILVNKHFVCKISDFGIATLQRITQKQFSSRSGGNKGTVTHTAPEFFQNIRTKPSEKTDVFSFGITLYEIVVGCSPYPDSATDEMIVQSLKDGNSPFDEEAIGQLRQQRCPNFLIELMENCVLKDASKRPLFKEIATTLHTEYFMKYEPDYNLGCVELYQRLCSHQPGTTGPSFSHVEANVDITDAPVQQGPQTQVKTAWPLQGPSSIGQPRPPDVQLSSNWQQCMAGPAVPPQSHYSPPPSYHSEDPRANHNPLHLSERRDVHQTPAGSTDTTRKVPYNQNPHNKFQLHSSESLPGNGQFGTSFPDPGRTPSDVSSIHYPHQESGKPKPEPPLFEESMHIGGRNFPHDEQMFSPPDQTSSSPLFATSNLSPNVGAMAGPATARSEPRSYSPSVREQQARLRQLAQHVQGSDVGNNIGRYTRELQSLRNDIEMSKMKDKISELENEKMKSQIREIFEKLAGQGRNISQPSYGVLQQNCVNNYQQIVQDIQPKNLLSYLIQDGFLTIDDADCIKSKQIRRDMAEELLNILLTKPESAMHCLAVALCENGQGHLSYLIDPNFHF